MMLAEAARPLGMHIAALEVGEGFPAEQAGAYPVRTTDLYSEEGLRKLARLCRVITPEIEHFNTRYTKVLKRDFCDVEPSPETVETINDKLTQRWHLSSYGIPVATYFSLSSEAHLKEISSYFKDFMIKKRDGAYDGRGNMRWSGESWQDILHLMNQSEANVRLYAEERVPFVKELSGLVARSKEGILVPYPVVETRHISLGESTGVCHTVLSPALVDEETAAGATELALRTVETFSGAGVFAVEMFLTANGELFVNEVAPRVHNSGHQTIEASETSQFTQHLQAVTGRELGSTALISPSVMINILGGPTGEPMYPDMKALKQLGGQVFGHWYGKSPSKTGRKMGHVTVLVPDTDKVLEIADYASEVYERVLADAI